MNNIERRDKGMAYISDDEIFEQQKPARILTQKLNITEKNRKKLKEYVCIFSEKE